MNHISKPRIKKVLLIFIACTVCAGVLLLLQPPCLIHKIFGVCCPACGTQRMFLALFRGDFHAAASLNPFMLIFLPFAGVYLLCESLRYIKEKPPLYKSRGFLIISIFIAAAALVFAFLRNLPQFAFLAPN